MIDVMLWQESNSLYLSAAMAWLRSRLENLSATASSADDPFSSKAIHADRDLTTCVEREPPPALELVTRLLGLSSFEQNVLLLCAGMELDTRIAALCAKAQDNPDRSYPTFALALSLFDHPSWDILSPERPLRYWKLIELFPVSGQPLTVSCLRADDRIVNFLKGLNYLDERLLALMTSLDVSDVEIPPSQRLLRDEVVAELAQVTSGRIPVVQLLGSDTDAKQALAIGAAQALGRRVYRISEEVLPNHNTDLDLLIRLWERESTLLPLALYVDAQDSDGPNAAQSSLRRFLTRVDGIMFLACRDQLPGLGRASLSIDVARATPEEQQIAWTQGLNGDSGDNPALLAGQFNLNFTAIRRITKSACEGHTTPEDLSNRLWDACRVSVRPRLDTLAQRIDAKATWNDIVLPATEAGLLREIAAQVGSRGKVYGEWGFGNRMNRGLGISALFAGDSGTGKTMAAEVIANDLRLNLYRIDLSAVVSKYIGETGKNLRRLFDAADDGGAILFFDEADALFGKRSEVKDSHDRYANIEINYLLQRIEAYRGLAILATNMKSSLDTAFMRRLRFIVNFNFPGVSERRRMWQQVFPSETPLGNLDYVRLARLNLTGGTIHNAALNAAFQAAACGSHVTMQMVLSAARTEMLKLDRPINEGDFQSREAVREIA
ncbi:ATP-binding protein [Edaphobacter sp. HDX4]|uniref:ATP-binding protein n=1 Tax=Edaphobacter sp. HDX4 TaxID=2794064 RepID=UPI002FE622BE